MRRCEETFQTVHNIQLLKLKSKSLLCADSTGLKRWNQFNWLVFNEVKVGQQKYYTNKRTFQCFFITHSKLLT